MRVLLQIPIEHIIKPKKPALNRKVLKFVLQLMRGAKFPPIRVRRVGNGQYELKGGRHRLAAHKLLGRKTINALLGVHQDPYPFKPLVHKSGDHTTPKTFDDVGYMEEQTWLQL